MKPAQPTISRGAHGDGKWIERNEKRERRRARDGSGWMDRGLIGWAGGREGGRGATRVAVHSVASIMQRHGVFAFP